MAVALTINGITYNYPELNDEGWGTEATKWATAVTQSILQKSGGLFALTGDLDFGPNFGLKSVYYKSRSANIALSGQVRLANSESVNFRNSSNTGDLAFGPGSSDAVPEWGGTDLVNLSATQTLTNKTITGATISGGTFNSPTINTPTVSGGTFSSPTLNDPTLHSTAGSYNFNLPSVAPTAGQVLEYNGSSYVWTVGAFSLISATLSDNTTNGAVASFTSATNNSLIFKYSLKRGSNFETGSIFIVNDGVSPQLVVSSAQIGSAGVTFSCDISGGNVRLLYTTTSTGSSASMKYSVDNWTA